MKGVRIFVLFGAGLQQNVAVAGRSPMGLILFLVTAFLPVFPRETSNGH